jgi:hypothetical protein
METRANWAEQGGFYLNSTMRGSTKRPRYQFKQVYLFAGNRTVDYRPRR